VIVKAGVVVVHPADQPDRDVLVAAQLLVRARRRVVVDEVAPPIGPGGQLGDEVTQLGARQVA